MYQTSAYKQRTAADDMNTWFAAGKLKPHIAHRLPLSQAAQARAGAN